MGVSPGRREPLKLRAGIDVPRLLGMNRYGSQGQIPDTCFHALENVRFVAGQVNERPGLVRAANQITGPIEGIYEAGDIGAPIAISPPVARTLYFTAWNSVWPTIVEIDMATHVETVHNIGVIGGGDPNYNLGWWGPAFIVGSDGFVYGPGQRLRASDGFARQVLTLTTLGTWGVVEVDFDAFTDYGGTTLEQPALARVAELLPVTVPPSMFCASRFIGGGGVTCSAKVYSYISGVVVLEDTVTLASPNSVIFNTTFAFNGTIYCGYYIADGFTGVSTDRLRKRSGVGVWSDVTMPAPPLVSRGFGFQMPIVYGSNAYIIGTYQRGGSSTPNKVLQITPGDVVSDVHTISNDLPGGTQSAVVFNGVLYYASQDLSNGYLGSFDGVTWTDVITTFLHVGIGSLVSDGINLWAVGFNNVSAKYVIYRSSGADVTTWTLMHTSPSLTLTGLVG